MNVVVKFEMYPDGMGAKMEPVVLMGRGEFTVKVSNNSLEKDYDTIKDILIKNINDKYLAYKGYLHKELIAEAQRWAGVEKAE